MSQTILIAGVEVPIFYKFSAGQPLSSEEASALNDLLNQEVQRKLEKKVKDHLKIHSELSPDAILSFQRMHQTFCEEHKFTPKNFANTYDPVTLLARSLAKPTVERALVNKGVDISLLKKEEIEDYISAAFDRNPAFKEKSLAEAKRRHDAIREVGKSALNIG